MGLVYSLAGLHVLLFSAELASKIKSLCACKSVGVGKSQMLEESESIQIPRDGTVFSVIALRPRAECEKHSNKEEIWIQPSLKKFSSTRK